MQSTSKADYPLAIQITIECAKRQSSPQYATYLHGKKQPTYFSSKVCIHSFAVLSILYPQEKMNVNFKMWIKTLCVCVCVCCIIGDT